MACRKPGVGAPGTLGPGPKSKPEPNLGLDTSELCKGMVLKCEM